MGRAFRNRRRKQKHNHPPSLNNNQCIITLLKSLKSRHWNNETQLELRDFRETGRGVCSKSSIQCDAILIKIPVTSMISMCTFKKDTFNFLHPLTVKRVQLSMQSLLSLFLCLEQHKGAASEWRFYLDSLPSCNPLTWLQLTSAEVARFPRHVAAQMGKFRALFARSWSATVDAISPTRRCTCCSELMHRVISVDLFAWCYAMINTRAVYIDPAFVRRYTHARGLIDYLLDEPNLALCPFLDMFNHSTEAQTTPEIINVDKQHYYVLRTFENHRRNEQIFISYGPHDNVKLFVEYGFFIPGNPFDTWPVPFSDVCKLLHFDEKQYKYVLSKRLHEDLYVTRSGDLSFNLKAVLFIPSSHPKDFERVYRDDYTREAIDSFALIAGRLMDVQLTLLTPKCFSDTVTHIFHEYLINFPISIINELRLRNGPSSEFEH